MDLAKKVGDYERPGCMPSAALASRTPRHAGNSTKKKGPENFRALVYGGAGGNRTPVRKRAAIGSTYVAVSLFFSPRTTRAAGKMLSQLRCLLTMDPVARYTAIL